MKRNIAVTVAACSLLTVGACNATGDEDRNYDTTRPSPATPTQSAPPDSTTGVARSSGRPGVAGDTVARSSDISAPKRKAP